MSRAAETSTPILPTLANRWSPRSYDVTKTLSKADLAASFEAARWAPSANNTQEWRYIVGFRGDATFDAIAATLAGWNSAWAPNAGALVVGAVESTNNDGQANPYALYDLGQSVAHFSVQAHADGLFVHQVAGTDVEALKKAFNLPAGWDAVVAFTVGHLADADALPEPLAEREKAPRTRRPLDETVFYGAL
jgi:nitroreductase